MIWDHGLCRYNWPDYITNQKNILILVLLPSFPKMTFSNIHKPHLHLLHAELCVIVTVMTRYHRFKPTAVRTCDVIWIFDLNWHLCLLYDRILSVFRSWAQIQNSYFRDCTFLVQISPGVSSLFSRTKELPQNMWAINLIWGAQTACRSLPVMLGVSRSASSQEHPLPQSLHKHTHTHTEGQALMLPSVFRLKELGGSRWGEVDSMWADLLCPDS